MSTKAKSKKVVQLPNLYKLALLFQIIETVVFFFGIILCIAIFAIYFKQNSDIEIVKKLSVGFYFIFCGLLTSPCTHGVKRIAENSSVYFLQTRNNENLVISEYEPFVVIQHVIVCTIFALLFFVAMQNSSNDVYGVGSILVLMYTIVIISFTILIYYKNRVTT